MKSQQKSVTLVKCKIYNWRIEKQHKVHLAISDKADNLLFQKSYLPQINQKYAAVTLAIKLTFPLEEKQVFVSFRKEVQKQIGLKAVNFKIELEKLAANDNFFITDFDNCIVNLITQAQSPYQLLQTKLKIRQVQEDNFIQQREEYLLKIQGESQYKHNKNEKQNCQKASSEVNQSTPYFYKKQEQEQLLKNKCLKIQQLLAKARDLSNQHVFIDAKSYSFKQAQRLPIQEYPILYTRASFQSQQEQVIIHRGIPFNKKCSHIHEHKHFFMQNSQESKKRVQYPHQSRTNDSYSAFSSQSQETGEKNSQQKANYAVFDAKSPFRNRYL